LPVVGQVDNAVERLIVEDAPKRREIRAVGLEVAHRGTQVMVVAPMQHRHVVAAANEPAHHFPSHELGAADDQDTHAPS
jgi:hypothetical protein